MNRQEMLEYVKKIRADESPLTLKPPVEPQAETTTQMVPTSIGDVRSLIHKPLATTDALPGFISFHGDGFISGTPEVDARGIFTYRKRHNVVC